MSQHDSSYSKYLTENNNFFYDEKSAKKSSLSKFDDDLFNEEDSKAPEGSIRVKRTSEPEDWQILVNNEDYLLLKGTRFAAKEREFLRTPEGLIFVINGAKAGWKSVSEFKRRIQIPQGVQ